jgi:hypothetical protein
VRVSLSRYSWLLFQWNIEAAIRELMRWLAPSPDTDVAAARQQLVRVHQAFLYYLGDGGDGAPGPAPGGAQGRNWGAVNPYSKLAVDVLQTIRRHELTLSPSVVAYLKMLVTLGTLRHHLASTYDLPSHVRTFFERMIRQQGATWLDPRLALDRLYSGGFRMRRALEFVEFLESQEPLIAAAEGMVFGTRRRLRAAGRRLMTIGLAALLTGGALYIVLALPDRAQAVVPRTVPYTWVQVALLAVLVLLILSLVVQGQRIGREE